MNNDNFPGIPSRVALLLIARHKYDRVVDLLKQTVDILKIYRDLILDGCARISEVPQSRSAREQLEELVKSARLYAEYHHQFTQKLDLETSYRLEGGEEFASCMLQAVSQRQELLHVLADVDTILVNTQTLSGLSSVEMHPFHV